LKRFIALHFIPGAAGNFLSRCINLLDDTFVWSNGKNIPNTLEEKLDLLTYKDQSKYPTWTDFEGTIEEYSGVKPHWDIGPNSNGVVIRHPSPADFIKNITGKDDTAVNIFIDHENNLDWVILNGAYKNSFQTFEYFENGFDLKNDPSVYKINLASIINGYQKFLPEFIKLAAFIDRTVTQDIEIALNILYEEWQKTVFRGPEFEEKRNRAAKIFRKIVDDFERDNVKKHNTIKVDTAYQDQLNLQALQQLEQDQI